MANSRSRLDESEREQRRARDRERLQRAAEQLLTSEGWEQWVRVRSRNGLSRYSLVILMGGRSQCVFLRLLSSATCPRHPAGSS
jgi:hypothetical protein